MTNEWPISGNYRNNAAYVKVKGVIMNPITIKRAPFAFECLIDTGFTSGLFYEETLRSDAQIVGVEPRLTEIQLGDGKKVPAYACVAYIEEINSFTLPPPGLRVELYMSGTRRGYIGMQTLKSCVTLFDGPKQTYKIRF